MMLRRLEGASLTDGCRTLATVNGDHLAGILPEEIDRYCVDSLEGLGLFLGFGPQEDALQPAPYPLEGLVVIKDLQRSGKNEPYHRFELRPLRIWT